jgi:DNA mismatch repair protein MutS2
MAEGLNLVAKCPRSNEMKNLTPQTETKLGYDTIRTLLEGRAATDEGKARCLALKPFQHANQTMPELRRVQECRDLLLYDESYSLDFTGTVVDLLGHAEVKGNWLNTRDFFQLLRWLRMVRDLLAYFNTRQAKYPGLYELTRTIAWNKGLVAGIEAVVDERGTIKDNASSKLHALRKEQAQQANDLRKTMQSILRNAVDKGWSDANELTIRNDRLVIPMKADFKGRIKGFVQDVSQSGQTIFLEPSSALEANNRLRELALEEHNEIVRILTVLTERVREDLPALHGYSEMVTRLDFIRAKGRLAVDLDAVLPKFELGQKTLMLVKARHPLLQLKPGMTKHKVVPLSITLHPKQRIILVSGPNAGGKSVSLKTVGLLQLMFQSGLLIPADESSEFTWFTDVFVDIGDEQSIASDLSTYTSHLRNLRDMQGQLRENKLFLMDELGGGTDPRLGGAIAEAFLERFLATGAYGIVTTHYGNLKAFADNREGIVNAAMQFDPETLSPTFRIEVGFPGRSYAFEIAHNVGVSEDILDDARSRVDGDQLLAEDLLLRLESQKSELEHLLLENRKKNEELAGLLKRNQELNLKIKEDEGKIIQEAHRRAQHLIDSANAKIENTIREIRESQADKERTKVIRRELAEMLPALPKVEAAELAEEEEEGVEFNPPEMLPGAKIEVGDWVLLTESNSYGQVLELQDKRAVVSLGEMRVTLKLKHLIKIKPPKSEARGRSRVTSMMVSKKANVSLEVSVKGFRVEQALPVVERFIDEAVLAGLPEARILHGKGTGALRLAIREFLAIRPEVRKMEDASIETGGAGWTVVHFK